MPTKQAILSSEKIERAILMIRGHKVMLDVHLAELYGVETKGLNRAVRRNRERFPEDFCFQLTPEDFRNLRFQFGTSNLRSQSGTSSWGGRRYPPYAFTEQGVAMPSSVLHSKRAVLVNIEIMRAFVRLRRMLASHGYVLTPGRYVGAEQIDADDEPFEQKMRSLTKQLEEQFAESAKLEGTIRRSLKGLGYGS